MKQRSVAPQYRVRQEPKVEHVMRARHHPPLIAVGTRVSDTTENITRGEQIRLILDRVYELPGVLYRPSRTSLQFDIELCHKHTPLDLPALLQSDDREFMHDVFGIKNHLDRQTGRLLDGFVPLFRVAKTQG
jgi:hypothetical protein